MSTKRINIKSIVLGIIAIAISITIGYGIARAEVPGAHGNLESQRSLGLRAALLRADLRADPNAPLAHELLLGDAALGGLNLTGVGLDTLDALEGRLLG